MSGEAGAITNRIKSICSHRYTQINTDKEIEKGRARALIKDYPNLCSSHLSVVPIGFCSFGVSSNASEAAA